MYFIAGFCLLLWSACQEPATKNEMSREQLTTPAKDSLIRIRINLVGDLMSHSPQINNAKLNDSTYDFKPSFEFIKPYLADADFTIGNLETTLAGKAFPYAGYPAFNTPDAYIDALKDAGFDLLVTANNHSMDTYEKGLLRTLHVLNQKGMRYTGTFQSQADKDSIRVLQKNDFRISVLNYTYGTNGNYPQEKNNFMLNRIDSATVTQEVQQARKNQAGLILVFYHWGEENKPSLNSAQQKAFKWAKEAGADLVIGAHPHVLGPLEKYKTQNALLDSGLLAYSLGNFLSNQYWRFTDAGVILQLELQYHVTAHKYSLEKIKYLPTWVYRGTNPAKKQHILLPAQWGKQNSAPAYLDEESKTKMREAFEDSQKMLEQKCPQAVLWEVSPL